MYRYLLTEMLFIERAWKYIVYNKTIKHIVQLSQIHLVMIELCYSILTGFTCQNCAILSLQGVFVRVVLFSHYRVYL